MSCFFYENIWKLHLWFHGIPWNVVQIQSSVEFHRIFPYSRVPWNSMKLPWKVWTTFEQHLWFHGIPWNFVQIQSSVEFHGIFSILLTPEFHGTSNLPLKIPWNSMKFHGTFFKFHGIPSILWILNKWYLKKILFLNIVVIWLMIICNLSKNHWNATYCIDFSIVIRILNTRVGTHRSWG